ncbi:MAG: NAD(P)-dependent dehydrogenase (short-subunit alcohol dehydrogenase family) [Limisphaerales bacterium]|jgi:NAD(P)-dependent dehydrogenase (short-subunit alcohol dehydrogenase family)
MEVSIITGANTGLGFEVCKAMAASQKENTKLIMACRSINKAEAAKAKILAASPKANIEIEQLDLSSLNSVRKCAASIQSKYSNIKHLINNAGIMMPPFSLTEDGFESQMAANYFGHFLLTGLLLDQITSTENSRIVSLSSNAHKSGKINFNDLQGKEKYSALGAYSQSKLACLMYAFELQKKLDKAGITNTISTAAHPGASETDLGRHMPSWALTLMKYSFLSFITHPPKNAARPTLMAAAENAEPGQYYGPTGFMEMKGEPGKASFKSFSKDEDVSKKLWDVSESLTGISYL